jgi:orotidine-5'-phosphate decarboxylase
MIPRPDNPVIVAIDTSDLEAAEQLAASLADTAGLLKVGLELFTSHGPAGVAAVARHAGVFLDLKLHDIPTTVERASRNCARLGAAMLNVHALGGEAMVAAAVRGARQGAEESGNPMPMVLAVTVLSSLSGESLATPRSLAFEAASAGARGLVVSGEDVSEVREVVGEDVALIVPGVRPEGADGDDQVRVLTPRAAIEAGADYLVIGRPITRAEDPAGAARGILLGLR